MIQALAAELKPDLANTVDFEVLLADPPIIDLQRVASRLARADSPAGSARLATSAQYVDGAIGRTLQIVSTPWTPR